MGSGSVGDGGASTLTPELKERIDKMVKETDVVVFMKVCRLRTNPSAMFFYNKNLRGFFFAELKLELGHFEFDSFSQKSR